MSTKLRAVLVAHLTALFFVLLAGGYKIAQGELVVGLGIAMLGAAFVTLGLSIVALVEVRRKVGSAR